MDRPIIQPSVICQPPSSPPSDSNMLSKTTMSYLNSTNIESLPDELLFDILVRLPADFLHHRARPVCRRWRCIIRSDAFINTQMQQYSTYGLVLSMLQSDRRSHSFYVTATQEGRIETSELSNIHMATSCNGLTLDINASGELHVINPLTKQPFLLPAVSICTHDKRDFFYCRSGIAYSPASMKYKVTLPYSNVEHSACLYIVTVGVDKSWRHVEIPPLLEGVRSLFYSYPLSSEGGFLHWGKERYCLTLNVETEMITMTEAPIPPPDQRYQYSYYYLSTGRYVSLLASRREFSWEVWETKPAERGDQWRKVVPDIDLEAQKCSLQQRFADGDERRLLPFGWVKYPEILAFCFYAFIGTCIFYNLKTREINTIDLPDYSCYDYTAFVHRNSLVWLSQD